MDRRIRKTRQSIFEAFLQLLKKKDFEQITMVELAEVADVNRVTIYKHFSDKYDLLDKCTEAYISYFLETCDSGTFEDLTLHAFIFLKEHRSDYQTLLGDKNTGVFHKKLCDEFRYRFNQNNLFKKSSDNSLYEEMKEEHIVTSLAGIFEWWIMASDEYSPEEAFNAYIALVTDLYKAELLKAKG